MNLDFFLDIFFPPVCVCCARWIARGAVCTLCRSGLVSRNQPLTAVSDGSTAYLVGAAGSYDNPVLQALIHALKFRFIQGAAEPLAEILSLYIEGLAGGGAVLRGFIVVPVPLARRRERTRGFNQSALIARPVAERLGLPFAPAALTRTAHRKPQSETKDLAERKENIRGCFSAIPSSSAGKNILLIDDVTTSGATFLEAARALTDAGALKIIALAVARA